MEKIKFKVEKSGTSASGRNWIMLLNFQEGFGVRAFITTEKLIKEGAEISIPSNLAKSIEWSL